MTMFNRFGQVLKPITEMSDAHMDKPVKKGLVMEGGGMRGMFVAGVCDVLMENSIEFDGAVGVSAGAAFGCNYKSRQIGRAIRCTAKHCRDKQYCSFSNLIKTGDLFGAEYCYHTIPDKLDIFDIEAFEKNPMDFYVVCTDVHTGRPVYRKCHKADYSTLEWIRASASLPLVSNVVSVDGYDLLDGGIVDSIPLRFFCESGYDKNIVILTQPEGYTKKRNKLLSLIKFALKKYPRIIEAMENRHIMYNNTVSYIKEAEKEGKAYVIRPDCPLPVGRTEMKPEKLWQTYNIGREIASKHIGEIRDYLN